MPDHVRDKTWTFTSLMVAMVIALNFAMLSLDNNLTREALNFMMPFVLGGVIAIGITSYFAWQRVPNFAGENGDGRRAGVIAVLLSYPVMGGVSVILRPFFPLEAMPEASIGWWLFAGVGASIVAFIGTAWLAVPLSVGVGSALVSSQFKAFSSQSGPAGSNGFSNSSWNARSLRTAIFVVLMGVAAQIVGMLIVGGLLSFDDFAELALLIALTCAVPATIASAIVWPTLMHNEMSAARGFASGAISSALTFPLSGLAFALCEILAVFGDKTGGIGTSVMAGAMFTMFALFFASLPAVLVGSLIGAGVATYQNKRRLLK